MFIDEITLSNADKGGGGGITTVSHTAWGYRISTILNDGRTVYVRSIRNGRAHVRLDWSGCGHWKYETALKHAENIVQGKYELV